jgi:hypothetical protein
MESEKARNSWNFTENHQTTDLAILQSLALKSRIVFCFFSGNSSYSDSVYTLGQIACQFSTAHAGDQDCSSCLQLIQSHSEFASSLATKTSCDGKILRLLIFANPCSGWGTKDAVNRPAVIAFVGQSSLQLLMLS